MQATSTTGRAPAADPALAGPSRSYRAWVRRALALGLLTVAGYAAYRRHHQLAQAWSMMGRLRLDWLLVAVILEGASMVAFARLQRWLLRSGGVAIGLGEMVEITLAGNAMGTSLPGGAAWAATWAFGQLRRRGADRVLAGWVILVAGALASFALFLLVASGAWLAGSRGPVANLRWLAAALAAIPLLAGGAAWGAAHSDRFRTGLSRTWSVVETRVPGARPLGRLVGNILVQLRSVRPGWLGWIEVFGLAMANWLTDAACLVACILALHLRVPWQTLLITYSLTKISASLPITPGGLGVVEGSMAALFVAYGMPAGPSLAVVLLYRIVSFWGLVPLGWATWLWLEMHQRISGGRRPHPWAGRTHAGLVD